MGMLEGTVRALLFLYLGIPPGTSNTCMASSSASRAVPTLAGARGGGEHKSPVLVGCGMEIASDKGEMAC
jgi:hypothetical protein